MKEWGWSGVVRVGFSVDGTKNNIRDNVYFVSKTGGAITAGQELSFTNTVTKGLEGVIHKDRVTYVRVTYHRNDPEWLRYEWCFNNNDNYNKLAEKLIDPKDNGKGTTINIASVDVASVLGAGYNIPTAGLAVTKAGDGTIAVNAAKVPDIEAGTARLVKAAEFEVSYTATPDGKQVLPTTMGFSATSTDVGSKAWKKISDDSTQENILKHVRVFKIIPTKTGTAVVDLVKEVPAADHAKVFSAQLNGENVNITANIMIRDATGSDRGGKFEGVKTFGSASYLMYMDGTMDGKFIDPIALVAYETPPDDTTKSSGGCTTAALSLSALLLFVPFVFKKRK